MLQRLAIVGCHNSNSNCSGGRLRCSFADELDQEPLEQWQLSRTILTGRYGWPRAEKQSLVKPHCDIGTR